MSQLDTVTSKYLYPEGSPQRRLFALWYFGSLITLWNIAGHTFLGFEQSWASPVVSVGTAALVTLLFEHLRAFSMNDQIRYIGGVNAFASTFIPALIPGLAVGMLLYPNESLAPLVFASALSIASKVLIRVPFGSGTQHIFNPSNFGITLTLFLFPAVGLAPPYHFTENLTGAAHWLLPISILISGLFVHGFATGRLPLCGAWLIGFVGQGLVRSWVFEIPWNVPLMPMTSAAFILFTLYMIPDPATTPINKKMQILFGFTVAVIYGVALTLHLVFGLFLALFSASLLRGVALTLFAAKPTQDHPVQISGTIVSRSN